MYFLPPIPAAEGTWRLPLVEPTAARLLACLGATHERHWFGELADTIAGDPALALWTVLRAGDDLGTFTPDVSLLTAWLMPRLAREMQWCEHSPVPAEPWPTKTAQRTADAVYQGFLVARLARDQSAAYEREFAYLLGLVSEAAAWGEIAMGIGSEALPLVPRWLRESLAVVAQESGGSPAIAAVRTAKLQLRVATERSLELQIDLNDERQKVEIVRHIWIGALGGAHSPCAESLAPLAARLVAADDLHAQFASRLHEEKLAALRELAYGATHEINNPLANISTRAETLLGDERHPERRRLLETIRAQAWRAHEMIADLMHFARPPQAEPEVVVIAPLVAQVLHEFSDEATRRHTELLAEPIADTLAVWADRTQLAVTLGALVRNSLEAIGQGGKVTVTARVDGDAALFDVIDNGPGFAAEAASHLFDPFYSGREAGRGLGFGLTKAWRIATGLGGNITGESLPGRGARFSLRIPLGQSRAPRR